MLIFLKNILLYIVGLLLIFTLFEIVEHFNPSINESYREPLFILVWFAYIMCKMVDEFKNSK